MGRTLDTLRHGDTQRSARGGPSARLQPDAAPEECVVDWTLQEEVPFIEVGGPGKTIECSPLLVKHPPQAKVQPPHAPVSKTVPAAKPAVNLTEPEPMAVALESWPRPAVPAGIAPEIIAHHQPEHAVSKEYAALLERMLQGHGGAVPRVLMLCGLRPYVGASTVLLNLAVTAAHRRRVAVVDMNRAGPALASRLGHAALGGLADVFAGSIAIGQALVQTAVPELHLLPAGGKGGPLTGEAIAWLAAWLRERFDVILIDGPCVAPAASIAGLVPHVDDVYVVLPQDEPAGATRGIAANIARMGGRLRGLIHTHFEG